MESEDLEDGNRFAEISDAWYMEDLLPLDESAGHIPPDPQSAEDTSRAIVALRQAAHASFPSAVTSVEEVLAMIRKLEAHMDQNPLSARELPAALVSSVDRSIQITQSRFLDSPASGGGSPHSDGRRPVKEEEGDAVREEAASVQDAAALDDGLSWRKYGQKDILGANKYPRSARTRHGAGMPEIPHSGSALLDFNMRETNVPHPIGGESSARAHPASGQRRSHRAAAESDRDPYSTGYTSCPSTAADMVSSSPDLEVNTGPGLPQSTRPSFDLGSPPYTPPPPIPYFPFPPSLIPCSQWEKGGMYRAWFSWAGLPWF